MYTSFEELMTTKMGEDYRPKIAIVAGANDEHVLDAVFTAQEQGYVTPVLVGDETETEGIIQQMGLASRPYTLVGTKAGENPSTVAVSLIKAGKGDFIIKGKLTTKDLLKPILNKETGLNSNGFITHFGYMKLKNYHKLLAISDCAVIPYPDLETKQKIVTLGIEKLKQLGYRNPVVGAMCAVETISKQMPETEDAAALQHLSETGEIPGEVIGPISYDLATSKASALIKGYDSPYAGDVDMLLVPNLVTGNAMSKIWNADADNQMAGCIIGADVPIALTSRSASMNEKLNSLLLCALLS